MNLLMAHLVIRGLKDFDYQAIVGELYAIWDFDLNLN